MFAGVAFDYDGAHFTLRGATGRPTPVQTQVPMHIGGGGPQLTHAARCPLCRLVELSGYALERIDELRPLAGAARVSVQHPVGSRRRPAERDEVVATVERRFGSWGGVVAGTADEVAADLAAEAATRGVEGFVLQFSDFGTPETIDRFMQEVAPVVARCGRMTP